MYISTKYTHITRKSSGMIKKRNFIRKQRAVSSFTLVTHIIIKAHRMFFFEQQVQSLAKKRILELHVVAVHDAVMKH